MKSEFSRQILEKY